MNFFGRLSILFYVTSIILLSFCFGVALSMGRIDYDVAKYLYVLRGDENLKYLGGIFACFLLVLNYIFYRLLFINERRDKIVAFDNPNGRVSVSLFALEDLIKRMLLQFIEIKDVKPVIRSTKKGLEAKITLVLKSDINIPEVTSKVQSQVLKKIQNTIGTDEKIAISVYVGKIHPERFKERIGKSESVVEVKDDKKDGDGPIVPFQGYKA